jgi:hypothetical protein
MAMLVIKAIKATNSLCWELAIPLLCLSLHPWQQMAPFMLEDCRDAVCVHVCATLIAE